MAQELTIEVKADAHDGATLLVAEKVARPPELKVAHGDSEPRPELVVLPESVESFAGEIEEAGMTVQQQVGIGLVLESSDPPAQLVELGKSKAIGSLDDDGIAVRDIQTGFDDGGADENLKPAVDKLDHDLLKILFAHLAVADREAGLGNQPAQSGGHFVDGLDPVVEIKDLPATADLLPDHLCDEFFRIALDDGDYRPALGRRRLDHAEVPGTDEGLVEGAWNGGRTHREHFHVRAPGLEDLLVPDTEALFLVDDDQSKILEDDVLLDQAMSADQDVDPAGSEGRQNLGLLPPGSKPADHLDHDGEAAHPLPEGVEVLLGEHGGGHEQGHLFPAHDRLEGGPKRDLGLAETDVAADQAIHGQGVLHVGLGVSNRLELIRGFPEGKGRLEFPLPGGVLWESEARVEAAPSLGFKQLGRVVKGRPFRRLAGLLPLAASDPSELWTDLRQPDIAGDEMGFVKRDVEGYAGVEFERKNLADLASRFNRLEAPVDGDSVLQMNHKLALDQLGEVEELIDLGLVDPGTLAEVGPALAFHPEDLRFADDDQARRSPDSFPVQTSEALAKADAETLVQLTLEKLRPDAFRESLLIEQFADPVKFARAGENEKNLFSGLLPFGQLIEKSGAGRLFVDQTFIRDP